MVLASTDIKPKGTRHNWSIGFAEQNERDRQAWLWSQAPTGFYTSGTTGQPQLWERTPSQIVEEVEVTAEVVGNVDFVYSTVDPKSFYGAVFTKFLPAYLGLDVKYNLSAYQGGKLRGQRPLVVAAPASWPGLVNKGILHARGRTVTVVHAGAPLPLRALEAAQDFDGLRIIELYGATETGLIAHRPGSRPCSPVPWRTVTDVEIGREAGAVDVPIRVKSSRLGRRPGTPPGDTLELADRITKLSSNYFYFDGRNEEFANPYGRKVSLSLLADQVMRALQEGGIEVVDVACVGVADLVAGEHIEALFVAETSPAEAAVVRALEAARRRLEVVPVRLTRVAAIERGRFSEVKGVRRHGVKGSGQ